MKASIMSTSANICAAIAALGRARAGECCKRNRATRRVSNDTMMSASVDHAHTRGMRNGQNKVGVISVAKRGDVSIRATWEPHADKRPTRNPKPMLGEKGVGAYR